MSYSSKQVVFGFSQVLNEISTLQKSVGENSGLGAAFFKVKVRPPRPQTADYRVELLYSIT